MKALVQSRYGTPEVLEFKDVERPQVGEDEVLVEVRALSLNASDWEFLTGSPLYIRSFGLLKPKVPILGSDIAGRVEAVGRNVHQLKVGDEVYGDILVCRGGFAEYVSAPAAALNLKPGDLSFTVAATLPQAASVALQGLRDKRELRPGDHVLVNGAGGGSGSFAIQFAKMFGAEVTAMDHGRKLDLMRRLGADRVMDYTAQDYTKEGEQYDLILDFVASHSLMRNRRALKPGGTYVVVGGSVPRLLGAVTLGRILSKVGSRKLGMLIATPNKDLDFIAKEVMSGRISPVIEREYSFGEAPEALRHLGAGRALGKLVVVL